MSPRLKRILNTLALTLVLIVLMAGVVLFQRRQFSGIQGARIFEEKMYLPNAKKLELATLGFKNLYADLLWLRAIQAFGARWQTGGGNMDPIYHYFDVVTDLDPQFIEAYKLGNLVIGDEGGDYQRSLDILRKGMWKNPSDWDLPYLGIYNAVWQMNDLEQARWFAYMAARKPDRPEFVARMREYIERKTGKLDVAFRMNLQSMLRYLDRGDDIQAKLTSIRFWDILDRLYKSELIAACRRFIALEGRDPETMDELLASKAWKPIEAPTMESLRDAINSYRMRGETLEPRLDDIAKRAVTQIAGVPPEPNGYTYIIVHDGSAPTTDSLPVSAATADQLPEEHFGYIINQSLLVSYLSDYVVGMNGEIRKFQQKNGRFPANMEELANSKFNYKDPLGGTFKYDPETGEFNTTSFEKELRLRERVYIE